MTAASTAKQVRIVCIGGDLNGGGAEHVQLDLLRRMNRGVFDIQLIYLRDSGDLHAFLPRGIEAHYLSSGRSKRLLNVVSALRKLWRLTRNADLVFGMQECGPVYLSVLIAVILRKPVIGWVHAPASSAMIDLAPWHRVVGPPLYRRANCLVGVSQGVVDDLYRSYGIELNRLSTIYNPIDIRQVRAEAIDPLSVEHAHWFVKPSILGIGRLVKEKRFDILIRAFAQEVHRGIDCHLILLGKGPEHLKLESLARELGVAARVFFAGFQMNPYPFIRAANVLAVSSDYEGLGMVLLEAMAIGTPVISTDCPSGPREILEEGHNGILVSVGDWESLGAAIARMLSCHGERARFIARGFRRVEEFEIERQVERWEELLLKVTCKAQKG